MTTEFKPPRTLGAAADQLYTTIQKRLTAQKKVDALKAQETALKDHIIRELPKSEVKGVVGRIAKVTVRQDNIPSVKDWDKFYAYIHRNKAYEMLQRRVKADAVKERWENKKKVPGVEPFGVTKVSCTKCR
jgi:hypothetical protein